MNNIEEEKYFELINGLNVDEKQKELIRKYKPTSKEEFEQINGIDVNSFNLNWKLLKSIKMKKANKNSSIEDLLKKLGDRLLNLSKSNKIILSNKLAYNQNIDLYNMEESSFNLLIDKMDGRVSENEDVFLKFTSEELENRNPLKSVTKRDKQFNYTYNLITRNSANIIEKGQDLLYIALGYLSGTNTKFTEEGIPFLSPILLIPVNIERDNQDKSVRIVIDDSRDVELNPFLKISFLKDFEYNNNKTIIENFNLILKDLKLDTSAQLKIKKDESIKVNYFKKFEQISIDEISSKIIYYPQITLGMFSKFDNSLQEDIEYISKNRIYSQNILNTFSKNDIYDNEFKINLENEINKNINDESNIFYANKLNYSQFYALKMVNSDVDNIVIDGPPGTGKSETIVSMIIDAILKNKKVAVVSEKKAALDVIHRRLGEMSKYALIINDIKDKINFYDQIGEAFDEKEKITTQHEHDLYEISSKIKGLLDRLDNSYSALKIDKFLLFDIIENWNKYSYKKDELILHERDAFYKVEDINQLMEVLNFLDDVDGIKKHIRNLSTMKLFSDFLSYDTYYEEKYYEKIAAQDELGEYLELYDRKKEILKFVEYLNVISFINWYKRKKFNRKIHKIDTKNVLEHIKKLKKLDEKKLDIIFNEYIDEKKVKLFAKEQELQNIYSNNPSLNFYFNLSNYLKQIFSKIASSNDIEAKIKLIGYSVITNFLNSNPNFSKAMENYKNYDDIIFRINKLQEEKSRITFENFKIKLNNTFNETMEDFSSYFKFKKRINQKRLLPIKKFVEENSLVLKNAYKIWLMQPEVVPHFFSPDEKFDLVIIDEASQMYLERSISILQRAKKVVILGDQKQLRPTNFFNSRMAFDENEYYLEADESILDHAVSKYTRVMLKTHYRSKYFELIDFSNKVFYDEKLLAISSPDLIGQQAIEFNSIKKPSYLKGENRNEANEVVERLISLIKDPINQGKTIGIISMNSKQNDLIEFKIETEVYQSGNFGKQLENISIFTKNIENVQGDEADIIIFSNTYGPDKDGKQISNFGPINQRFGENRINVAITRAKEKMIIFNSIDLEQLVNSSSTSKGYKAFIDFIYYAKNTSENSKLFNAKNKITNEEFKTIIEEKIYESLKDYLVANKLKIINDFKFSGYRMNFVVFDKNDKPILGIDIDDKYYHVSKWARERDLSRIQYLIDKGWNIHKIWSGNWFNSSDFEIKKVINKLDELIK